MNSCAAAVEELVVTRKLVTTLETENAALRERLATASQTESVLTELNNAREKENTALNAVIAAKNETIAAKDAALAKQDELIAALKKRKTSLWKRIGDVLIGVAVAAILK